MATKPNFHKIPASLSHECAFRALVTAEIRALVDAGLTLGAAIVQLHDKERVDLLGRYRKLRRSSLYRWIKVAKDGGIASLEPAQRARLSTARALSPELVEHVIREKQTDPEASIPEILRRAEAQGTIPRVAQASRTTVWRVCQRQGLPLARPLGRHRDVRRFAREHRMQMVLADGQYFRAGAGRLRRVAMTFLDDASRFGLGSGVGTSESVVVLFPLLREVIRRFGFMTMLYLDHGSAFVSDDLKYVCARLGIALIHGEVAYPQGHGKIERFHRTRREQLLRGLVGNPSVDPDLPSLGLRLEHWLHEVYNRTPHESHSGVTPEERWLSDSRPLALVEDQTIDDAFVLSVERRVSLDHVVKYRGQAFEVPVGLAGRRIRFEHRLISNELILAHDGQIFRLRPVDVLANARDRRASRPADSHNNTSDESPHETAASRRFDNDLGPIVTKDGGFPKKREEK